MNQSRYKIMAFFWIGALSYNLFLATRVMKNFLSWQINLVVFVISGIILILASFPVVWGFLKYRHPMDGVFTTGRTRALRLGGKTLEEALQKNYPVHGGFVIIFIKGLILYIAIEMIFLGIFLTKMGIEDFIKGPQYYHGPCQIDHQHRKGREYYAIELSNNKYHFFDLDEKYGKMLIDPKQFELIECPHNIQVHYLETLGIIDVKIDS